MLPYCILYTWVIPQTECQTWSASARMIGGTSDPSAAPVPTKVKKHFSLKCCARPVQAPTRIWDDPKRMPREFLQLQPPRDWEPLWLRQARQKGLCGHLCWPLVLKELTAPRGCNTKH
jgi:hypothetical protein